MALTLPYSFVTGTSINASQLNACYSYVAEALSDGTQALAFASLSVGTVTIQNDLAAKNITVTDNLSGSRATLLVCNRSGYQYAGNAGYVDLWGHATPVIQVGWPMCRSGSVRRFVVTQQVVSFTSAEDCNFYLRKNGATVISKGTFAISGVGTYQAKGSVFDRGVYEFDPGDFLSVYYSATASGNYCADTVVTLDVSVNT